MNVIARLAEAIDALHPGGRVMVAIDGPDAAGKSTVGRALAGRVARQAACVSIDGWHNPRADRLRRGDESPAGYYADSFNYDALVRELLNPFRAGASSVVTAWFDHVADAPRRIEESGVGSTAALLFDGVFLLRPELRQLWDLRVYLDVPESVTLARAVERDADLLGGAEQVRRRYESRYLPGQLLYRETASPLEHADILIDNSNPERPRVIRWHG